MVYLLLSILCSSSIALIFKYTETKDMNRYGITSVNYLTASLVSLCMMLSVPDLVFNFNTIEGPQSLLSVFSGRTKTFNIPGSIYYAILLGIVTGFCFYYSFIFYQKSVRDCGASLSGMFGKLGILIPMIVSIVIWREFPSRLQTVGISLSLLSILIINMDTKNTNFKWKASLLFLFLFGGLAEFSNKLFQQYALTTYKTLFLFVVFTIALLVSIISTLRYGKSLTLKDVFFGFLVGIPNLFSSYFLIMSLNHLPTTVVFPVYSAGSIIIILLGSRVFYNELLMKKEWIAVITTLVALVLINI